MRSAVHRPAILAAAAIALVAAAIALVALVAACSSSGSSPASSPVPTNMGPVGTLGSAGGTITVTDAWVRATPPGTTTSAVYLTLTNGTGTDDALVWVSTPAAGMAEIHQVSAASAAPAESTGMGGAMMGMHPIEKLPLPAGGSVKLEPGSFHIMLIDVKEPLKEGATIEVTLNFEKTAPITLTILVKMV